MSAKEILKWNWSAYDNRKKREHSDHRNFSGTVAWEVNFLGRAIRKLYPGTDPDTIRAAIKACCKQAGSPVPRAVFVTAVMKRLELD